MFEQFLSNFSGGEVSPEVYGRFDSELYKNVLKRCQNFISLMQGAAQYRGGSSFVHPTRLQQTARTERFKFNDEQVYILEFTALKLRIYEDAAVTVNSSTETISAATKADPCVLTVNGHSLSTDDEIYVSGVVGMTELNGRFFRVVSLGPNTVSLKDLYGNAIDSQGFTTYTSGGTAAAIYELTSPYPEANLEEFQFDQEGDVIYLTHEDYDIYKLTRVSATSWTLAVFARTADPFVTASQVITGVTQANPGVVTIVGHELTTGDRVYIEDVVGMTELNDISYTIVRINDDTFSLKTLAGVAVNTSGYTAYDSAGTIKTANYPRAVSFYEGCLYYAGLKAHPDRIVRSRGPDTTGATRYDDFTTGADADHAIILSAATGTGDIAFIQWLAGLQEFLAVGTEGGVLGLDGNNDAAITPTNFRIRPIDPVGVQSIMPVINGQSIFYMQKGSRTLRSFEYDVILDNYRSTDRQFLASHLTVGGIKKLTIQRWKTDILWAVRNDGVLLGLTIKPKEDVSGWHQHSFGGGGTVVDVVVEPQAQGYDRLYVVIERTINSITTRYVEYVNEPYEGVIREDYFTDEDSEDDDITDYLNAVFAAQQASVYLDGSLTYDGVATTTITGLWHLEGETVSVVADGRKHIDAVVSDGSITLAFEAEIVHIGYKYKGIVIPLNLVVVGAVQNTIGFEKNISTLALVVAHTIGVKYGTSLYTLQEIPATQMGQLTDTAPVPVTGTVNLPVEDNWSVDKQVVYVQDDPYPCMLNAMSMTLDVGEK